MCIYYFINFCSHQFFSLFSVHNDLNSSSSFPQMHKNTPTHKHIHTNKSTQKYTHTQTNPHRQTNGEIDRCLWSLVRGSASEERIWVTGAWFVDRSVKKGSRSWSLVRGSTDEERIWIGRWRKDPVKKWSGLVVFEKEWEKVEKKEREREREVICSGKMSIERENAYLGKG